MRILLTNDDGIRAPGIMALHRALVGKDGGAAPLGDVYTVAPLTPQSATGHGITYHEPLMTSLAEVPSEIEGVAVDGRPADCVKLALASLWQEHHDDDSLPELVVSGMNAGANCGINVIYSGTVAAAIEAAFLGIPSIAVSLHLGRGKPRFDIAAMHARRAIDRVLATGLLEPHSCININIPRCEEPGSIAPTPDTTFEVGPDVDEPIDLDAGLPIAVCPINTHGINDRFERRESPGSQVYYWPAGGGLDFHATDAGTDVERLFARCITVTPLHFDLTDHSKSAAWQRALGQVQPSR